MFFEMSNLIVSMNHAVEFVCIDIHVKLKNSQVHDKTKATSVKGFGVGFSNLTIRGKDEILLSTLVSAISNSYNWFLINSCMLWTKNASSITHLAIFVYKKEKKQQQNNLKQNQRSNRCSNFRSSLHYNKRVLVNFF